MKKICRKCGVEVNLLFKDLIPDTEKAICSVCQKIDNKKGLLKAMNDIWKEEVGK